MHCGKMAVPTRWLQLTQNSGNCVASILLLFVHCNSKEFILHIIIIVIIIIIIIINIQ